MIKMPGKTFTGPLPPLGDVEQVVRNAIHNDVEHLATKIGERNLHYYANLCAAADFIQNSFEQAGYEPKRQNYDVSGKTEAPVGFSGSSLRIFEPKGQRIRDSLFLGHQRKLRRDPLWPFHVGAGDEIRHGISSRAGRGVERNIEIRLPE